MPASSQRGPGAAHWRPLQLFNFYRILVALLFLGLWLSGLPTRYLGRDFPHLYAFDLLGYLTLGIVALAANRLRRPPFAVQAGLLAGADIVFVILLMHASGGIDSGLGVLLIPAVAATGVLLPGIWPLFAAAAASLLLLGDQIALFGYGLQDNHGYAAAGFLGLALFATALVSRLLAERARRSEEIAVRRGIDLANLTQLGEHIVEQLRSGLIVTDREGRVRLINGRAKDLLGLPPAGGEGRLLARLAPPLAERLRLWRSGKDTGPWRFRPPGRRDDVRVDFAALEGAPDTALITLQDQAELSEQIQAAKLGALGRLSASIAHEIRNPLSSIAHAAQLLEESASLAAPDRRLLEIIRAQSGRIDRIIEDVLRLARREPPAAETLDLARWLPERAQVLRGHCGPACAWRLDIDAPALPVVFDAGHLEQILAGLCENASRYGRDAHGGLSLTVSAARDPASGEILLTVCDAGPGIAPEHQAHLFEPFFTTSSTGTGLGLYLARELCALNRARIEYLDAPGGGACFRLRLPPPP